MNKGDLAMRIKLIFIKLIFFSLSFIVTMR